MQIEFGYQLDGVSWSDREAAAGAVRTGPEGLLSILETRCGVTAKAVDRTARVAEMYALLGRMDADDAWFHDSFRVDPWATAQELLAIADELREAGVAHKALADGSSVEVGSGGEPSPRIAGMTRVAEEAEAVAGGMPERFARVIEELHRPEKVRIAVVTDLEISVDLPYDYLTPIWQAVFDALRRCGGAVSFADAASLSGNGPEVTILRTGDEWEAAEYVAAYLSTNLEVGLQSEPTREEPGLALLIEADATALDHTLSKRGLPLTGATRSSSARWELQLLPAFLSTFWTPVDPHAIAAFLSRLRCGAKGCRLNNTLGAAGAPRCGRPKMAEGNGKNSHRGR